MPFVCIRNKILHDAKRLQKRKKEEGEKLEKDESIRQTFTDTKNEILKQLSEAEITNDPSIIFCLDTDKMNHSLLEGSQMLEHIFRIAKQNREKSKTA